MYWWRVQYGVEIWGWKEYKEIESIQEKYIKWTLKLNRTTPNHMLYLETKREKIASKAGKRAIKYEEKILKSQGNEILKECIKVKNKFIMNVEANKRRNGRERWKKARKEFLERRGWSIEYYFKHKLKEENVAEQAEEIGKCIERQENEEKLRNSRFAEEYKSIAPRATETPEYLINQNNRRNELELKAKFRLGTETRAGRYWMEEESRKCRLCMEKEKTLKHVFEECKITGEKEQTWIRQITGKKALARMSEITWKRKAKEKEEKNDNEEEADL